MPARSGSATISARPTNSGDGTGGTINIYARDGNSTLTVSGPADLDADGVANAAGRMLPVRRNRRDRPGRRYHHRQPGRDRRPTATSSPSRMICSQRPMAMAADGVGGAAGDGFGGTVTLTAADGNRVNVTGDVRLEAIGFGGFDAGGFVAGDGTGGFARITTFGHRRAPDDSRRNVIIDASGFGGDSELHIGRNGRQRPVGPRTRHGQWWRNRRHRRPVASIDQQRRQRRQWRRRVRLHRRQSASIPPLRTRASSPMVARSTSPA